MVGISGGFFAELVDCVQGEYSAFCLPYSNTKPIETQSSTAVTDALLEQISGNLSSLDELHLTGCRKVTHEGLVNALRHNKNGIKSLTIESVSPSFVRSYASPST